MADLQRLPVMPGPSGGTQGSNMERSDAELLEASRRGERAAFAALVERYQGVVCAVSYSRTGDRALSEDVAQDTFLAAWRQLDQVREVPRFGAWLCGIARNLSLKARRRRAREAPVEHELEISSSANLFDEVSDRQAERVVREALHRVPETYREALVLYYQEQRSAREVAQILGISEAAVLQRLARGRQALAASVSGLVERALSSPLPRRSLVAGVLAALPALHPIAPSHAATTQATHGGPMLKLALAAAALTAAGTVAYVTRAPSATPSSTRSAAPAAVAGARVPGPPPPSPAAAAAPSSSQGAPAAGAGASDSSDCATCTHQAPDDDELPLVDAKTLARLRVHEGPSRGPADAPVTIVVFNDMKCHYCGEVLGAIDQLFDEYEGKLRLVVHPLPVRPASALAAEASLAAEAQGKFWELHDLMLANQDSLDREGVLALAGRAGLDTARLAAALDAHTYEPEVKRWREVALELEVQGAPGFIINGKRIAGARPVAYYRSVIDAALAAR